MAEIYDMETQVVMTEKGQPVESKVFNWTTLKYDLGIRGFVGCCGAQLLVGFYPDREEVEVPASGTNGTYKRTQTKVPPTFTLPKATLFALAVTSPTQETNPALVKALEEQGYERLGKFMGMHGYELTLWGGGPSGRRLKPAQGDAESKKELTSLRKELEEARGTAQKLTLREQKLSKELGELKEKLSLRRSLRKGTSVSKRVNRTKAKQPSVVVVP